jgi:hypothetical protein
MLFHEGLGAHLALDQKLLQDHVNHKQKVLVNVLTQVLNLDLKSLEK